MPKKTWFLAALSWTVLIVLLCLISFSNLPSVGVASVDKYVHSIFHFVFTVLWIVYFKSKNATVSSLKIAIGVMLLSLLFGATIEIAQEMLTETRKADVMDVAANFAGSLIASLALAVYHRITKK